MAKRDKRYERDGGNPSQSRYARQLPPGGSQAGRSAAAAIPRGSQAGRSAAEEKGARAAAAGAMARPGNGREAPGGLPVGPDEIRAARKTLDKYRAGKSSLDRRIIDNEEWYRLRHWARIGHSENKGDPEPTSAWLLNSIANKHADAMDHYPEPVVLPREQSDAETAQALSQILPVIMEQSEYQGVYSDKWWRKLKTGTSVEGVFWDAKKHGGLGDVDIRAIDLLKIYWEPGVTDIQKSRNVFVVELTDNDLLTQAYPQLEGKLGGQATEVKQYVYDDSVDTAGKSVVVDWYYKTRQGAAVRLNYVKFVGEEVLYASENDPRYARRGYYDHGKYPFVFDTLFPCETGPAGFGYLDICKDAQMYIDKLNQVILKNAVMATRPRYFVKGDGAINELEFADWSRDFVHFSGAGAPQDAIMPIDVRPLDGNVLNVLSAKIDELKETSGNRDFSQGATSSGVTAASAIAALQEAGSKLSRDMINASYRAFAQISTLCVELIRQFYDTPRCFRILGGPGQETRFVDFDNRGMRPQPQGVEFGLDLGARLPVFDVKIKAQKSSPFVQASQNEMAKEFYGMGFFNPQMADQALSCLEMMEFEGKQEIIQRITQNGTIYEQLLRAQVQLAQLAQIVDAQNGTTIGGGLAAEASRGEQVNPNRAQASGRKISGNSAAAKADAAQKRARNAAGPEGA